MKNLVDKKSERVYFDIKPKTNEKEISVTFRCIKLFDRYQFSSSSLDSLVKTLTDKSHQSLKTLTKEIVDDEKIKNANEIETLTKNDTTIEDLKKDVANESE